MKDNHGDLVKREANMEFPFRRAVGTGDRLMVTDCFDEALKWHNIGGVRILSTMGLEGDRASPEYQEKYSIMALGSSHEEP